LREALAARLERYIVADDVALEDVTGKEGLLHCVGFVLPTAGKTEGGAEATVKTTQPTQARADGFPAALAGFPRIAAARLGEEGWDVLVPLEQLATIKQSLGSLVASEGDWEKRRILRGVPAWGKELDENTLPPEAGLERTHIDYHKGCYIGQEVISRLKSVGHVNRTLCRFRGTDAELPAAGAAFFTESGAEAGALTSVTRLGKEGFLALGYVKRAHEAGPFFCATGAPLNVIPA
jgi:folate-binding Fe-S cluster repair protein YgfZ